MTRLQWSSLLVLAVILGCGGCDGASDAPAVSSSNEQTNVKGRVTWKRKPLAKVDVKFNAANIKRKTAATVSTTTNDDGTYEIKSLVGENSVTLSGGPVAKNNQLQYFRKVADLQSGDNTVDLDIP